jgi:hypothetical protein
MKKLIIIMVITLAGIAYAEGFLVRTEVRGMLRYCYYNNGHILTVSAYQHCPQVIK